MPKKHKSKKRINNQQYDKYWSLTVEYTDIYGSFFNNTLKIIINFIDEHNLQANPYDSKLNKILQEKINLINPKKDFGSVRKAINQFIKLGFVLPEFKGYHKLAKKFLNTKDMLEKKQIFSNIFYENSSFNSTTTKNHIDTKETNFLLKTLAYHPNKKLEKNDIIALMVTNDINKISKGYLTKDELENQYNFAKAINFEEKKYNQLGYLINFLNYIPNITASKNNGITFKDPNEVEIDTNRDPIRSNIYKSSLKEESTNLYGKPVCYVDRVPYKGLVCSHIKDLNVCLKENDIDAAYDYHNGLLLQPNIDAYFDKYDISFDNYGNVLINDYSIKDSDILHKLSFLKIDNELLIPERLIYLEWHRKKFKEKAQKDKIIEERFYKEN